MAKIVEGITRKPLPYGLFSVVTPRPGDDSHWQNLEGVAWETLTCSPASGIGSDFCGDEPAIGLPKNLDEGPGGLGEATPFTVYGSYNCNPVGHSIAFAQEQATLHLLAREEARAEQALWTGDLGNPGFAADSVDAAAGALSVRRAIARLEDWLAKNYGSQGVIHMTREAAEIGLTDLALVIKGNGLFTALGTPVVAGAGYPGTGPAGQTPSSDQTYIYATPALLAYRSEPFPGVGAVEDGLDRDTNDLHSVMERTYILGYDPCGTAYVLSDLPE